ncbi:hypothetical protein AB5J55_23235 [Streptomyces sp. R11]|uniref:Uncharacterized protein n=1 Tax=Streptomyces sp. R11 TaxID=3238625 RepID=A0AB39N5X6_9ACTN
MLIDRSREVHGTHPQQIRLTGVALALVLVRSGRGTVGPLRQ